MVLVLETWIGHKNWILLQLFVNEEESLEYGGVLFKTQEHSTKYDGMELKPKLIILPQSSYFVLLRQFYNDSQAVIFQE